MQCSCLGFTKDMFGGVGEAKWREDARGISAYAVVSPRNPVFFACPFKILIE